MKWISVDDRYPEEYGIYLCYFSDGVIETFYFGDNSEDFQLWGVHNALVTHWMPLPDPPNKNPGQ